MDSIDPEIAALLESVEPVEELPSIDEKDEKPKFNKKTFFDVSKPDLSSKKRKSIHDVDLSQKSFEPIEEFTNSAPSEVFNDTKYYKIALTGENEYAQRVHQLLSKYLTTKDPKDRALFRQQLITPYWELLRGMIGKLSDPNIPLPKKMLVRFGIVLPSLLRNETKDFFSKIFIENRPQEPILYIDEWFKEIASGRMTNSATDEKAQPKSANMNADQAASAEQSRLLQLQSKNSGKLQSVENILQIKENERDMLESEIKNRIGDLFNHIPLAGLEPHKSSLSESQRKLMADISELLHRYSKNDKELSKSLDDFTEAKATCDTLNNKIAVNGGEKIIQADSEALGLEFETVRQMSKMTVGRRGNQFPIFTREFYHCTEKGTGSRENVIDVLRWVESLDPGVFCRIHKNVPHRIVPYVLLVPTYGDRGFCWEPFDRYNRVTSRGRVVIPMYPKDLKIAVLTALADLRWQVAKEKASYYWMEEGLTGQYYQHMEQLKAKGDLKEFFIEDYILWMTKESNGVQRLDKEVRGIFWRNMPFPKELKEDLRKRSLVYDDLCKKDANREMSDGY